MPVQRPRPRRSRPDAPPPMAPLDQALHDAMVARDLDGMRDALTGGANPHLVEGSSPLWFQCTQFRTPGMLKLFLDAGVHPNTTFESPSNAMSLILATAYQGTREEFDLALRLGGDPDALSPRHHGVVYYAVFNGSTNGRTDVLEQAIRVAPWQVKPDVDPDHPMARQSSPLVNAIRTSHPASGTIVEMLLQAGANLYEQVDGGTSLVALAQRNGNTSALSVLERWVLRDQLDHEVPDLVGRPRPRL